MSYGNPKPQNPAVRFIDFKGDTGKFVYYQKDSEENVELPLPIKFIVIDELSTIAGFNDENQTGIYSNEVHNISKEILSVRLFPKKDNGKIKNFNNHGAIGLYKDIKGGITSLGGKFAKSVYALIVENGKAELVNFKIKGAFISAWIAKTVDPDNQGILINDVIEKKKGKVTYYEPVIEGFTPPDPIKTRNVAQKYYKLLHEYFASREAYYVEQQAATETEPVEETPVSDTEPQYNDDDLPF